MEGYVEHMVARKPDRLMMILRVLGIVLGTLSFGFTMVAPVSILFVILAIALYVGAYFAHMRIYVEYEYLYCDRELTVDRILNRAKRKKVANYSVERMELIAPERSHKLDSYKNNRAYKDVDYASGEEHPREKRYMMCYDGKERVLLEPGEEIIKAIRNIAPRKVATD